MDIKDLQKLVIEFREKRDWKQFHNPKDIAAAIAVETSELQEKFLWMSQKDSYKKGKTDPEVVDEVADILNNVLLFADACNIDLSKACIAKLKQNDKKYPVNKSKGKCDKYHIYNTRTENKYKKK